MSLYSGRYDAVITRLLQGNYDITIDHFTSLSTDSSPSPSRTTIYLPPSLNHSLSPSLDHSLSPPLPPSLDHSFSLSLPFSLPLSPLIPPSLSPNPSLSLPSSLSLPFSLPLSPLIPLSWCCFTVIEEWIFMYRLVTTPISC